MKEENIPIITVKRIHEDFEYWTSKPYISEKTKTKLLEAKVLILPIDDHPDVNELVFNERTQGLFEFLQSKFDNPNDVEICIEEPNYKTIMIHSALERLGIIMLQYAIAPITVSFLYDYIKNKLSRPFTPMKFKVCLKITNIKGNEDDSIQIDFEGSANDFHLVIDKIQDISKNHDD